MFDISLEGTKSSFGRLHRTGINSTHYKSSWHMMVIEFRISDDRSGHAINPTLFEHFLERVPSIPHPGKSVIILHRQCYMSEKLTQDY
jgi:hypothetical protein